MSFRDRLGFARRRTALRPRRELAAGLLTLIATFVFFRYVLDDGAGAWIAAARILIAAAVAMLLVPAGEFCWHFATATYAQAVEGIGVAEARIEALESQAAKLEESLGARPAARVRHVEDPVLGHFLEVTNVGAGEGDFQIEVEFISGWESTHGPIRPPARYRAVWEGSGWQDCSRLLQGQTDRAKIAELKISPASTLSYELPFYDPRTKHFVTCGTTSWIPGTVTIAPRFDLRIQVSASPALSSGPLTCGAVLDEHGFAFEPVT